MSTQLEKEENESTLILIEDGIPSLNLSNLDKVGDGQYKKQDIPTGSKFLGSDVYKGILYWSIPYTDKDRTTISFTNQGMYLLSLKGTSSTGGNVSPIVGMYASTGSILDPTGVSTCPNDNGDLHVYLPKLSYLNNQGGITKLGLILYAEFFYTKGWPRS